MEASMLVRGESAKISRERRASLEKKQKVRNPPPSVEDMLEELAILRSQTPQFFTNERGLCGQGLNPKLATDMLCVTPEKIEETWGKCTAYRVTSTSLKPETRRELLDLYSKIYGKRDVTNKEFMAWMVKGHIAEQMGHPVDWASAAAATSSLVASRLEGDLLKRDLSTQEAAELHRLAPTSVLKPSAGHSRFGVRSTSLSEHEKMHFKDSSTHRVCHSDVTKAEDVLKAELGLLASTESKLSVLETSKKSISDMIIAFKFGMDDRRGDTEEAEQNLIVAEEAVKNLDLQRLLIQDNIQKLRDNLDEGSDDYTSGLERLEGLKSERDVLVRNVEFARFSLEETHRRAKKAEALYENAGNNMCESEGDIEDLRRQVDDIRRHTDALADQILRMKNGRGVVCYPQPALHPDQPEDGQTLFELQPCSFCSRWYNSFDVVMTSCKHFYHPFCVSKLVDLQHSCVTCNEPFDLDWCRSFGFTAVTADREDLDDKVFATKSLEELTDNVGVSALEGSQSRGKLSEWGSSGSMYLAQPSTPCGSADKAKISLMPEDRVPSPKAPMPSPVAAEKSRFEETEEVNSPGKPVLPRNPDQSMCEPVLAGAEDEAGRCTSSLKRALNPATEETVTRKKVTATDRGNKSTAGGTKKPPGFRKGNLEGAALAAVSSKGKKVLRSSSKKT